MPGARSKPSDVATRDGATRLRLLDAAADVFAKHGYRAATVREICRRARANVAAVNYHFGGKEGLYGALLSHLGRAAVDRYPPNLGVEPDASAEERLRAFVHSFLLRTLSSDGIARHGALMAREMAEPTRALDRLVEDVIRPLFLHLRGIVRELLGPRATHDEVVLCTRSIIGQCLFYHHARAVVARLAPGESMDPRRVRELAQHVTRFSLEGLHRAGAGAPKRSRAARASARRVVPSAVRGKRSSR